MTFADAVKLLEKVSEPCKMVVGGPPALVGSGRKIRVGDYIGGFDRAADASEKIPAPPFQEAIVAYEGIRERTRMAVGGKAFYIGNGATVRVGDYVGGFDVAAAAQERAKVLSFAQLVAAFERVKID